MKLIDANKLNDLLLNVMHEAEQNNEQAVANVTGQLIVAVGIAPAIDAVQVVRCKDCKHSRNDELWHMRWCKGVTVKDEHFCADGERRRP